MTRSRLLWLSVLDCMFGLAFIVWGRGGIGTLALLLNFGLAVALAFLTYNDLWRRGWTWPALVVSLSYVVAPLIGLVLYAIASRRNAAPKALADSPA